MSAHSPEAVKKQVRAYIAVFGALGVLTVLTVGASYLHLSLQGAIALALVIASIKAALVAAVFMHLNNEKKVVWLVLVLAIVFFFVLLMMPSWHLL